MLFLTRVFLGDSVTFFSFFPTFATTSKIEDATTAAFNPVRKGVPCREGWDELRGEEDKETAGRFPSGVTNPSASRFWVTIGITLHIQYHFFINRTCYDKALL